MKGCKYLKLDIHKDVLKSFNERAPYEYLQLCYYKVITLLTILLKNSSLLLNAIYNLKLYLLFSYLMFISSHSIFPILSKHARKCSILYFTPSNVFPGDEEMKNNRNVFVEEGTINFDWFIPRDEAINYFNRDKYKKYLIEFINKQFVFDDDNQMDIYGTIENDDLGKETNKSEVCMC